MNGITILAVIEQDQRLIFQFQGLCTGYGLHLSLARSHDEAILYLRGVGVYADRDRYPIPRLILLDSANPAAGDLAVLEWLRQSSQFVGVPIGLLAEAPSHRLRVACAIDERCFVIDRNSPWEFASVVWEVAFAPAQRSSDSSIHEA